MRDFKRDRGAASTIGLAVGFLLLIVVALFAVLWILDRQPPLVVAEADVAEISPPPGSTPASAETAAPKAATTSRSLVADRIQEHLTAPPRELLVTGTVLGPDGRALEGAKVVLRRAQFRNPLDGVQWIVIGDARSDATGRFELMPRATAQGRCSLHVRADGVATRTLDHLRLPATGESDLGPITLLAGFVAFGKVLLESDQSPVAGAVVRVLPQTWEGLDPADVVTARTDARGAFRVTGVPADLVHVEVEASGLARATLTMVSLVEEPDELSGMVLHLYPAHSLTGRVLDFRGQPVAGSRVAVQRSGPVTTCAAEMRSGADGRFAFHDLQEGYYDLVVEHADHAPHRQPSVHTDAAELEVRLPPLGRVRVTLSDLPVDRDVEVQVLLLGVSGRNPMQAASIPRSVIARNGSLVVGGLEEDRYALEIRVPGAAPTRTADFSVFAGRETDLGTLTLEAGTTVQGRVLDGEGHPLVARVAVLSPAAARLARDRGAFSLMDRVEVQCDAEGRFELSAIAAGHHLFAWSHDGFLERLAEAEVPADRTLDLGDVVLSAAGTLLGLVKTPGGQPVAATLVDLEGEGIRQTAKTDAEGRYEFLNLAAGLYRVGVARPDGLDEQQLARALQGRTRGARSVQVVPGAPTRLDLVLPED